MTKHIFITGGVVSSLGKGLTSAAIGMILERFNASSNEPSSDDNEDCREMFRA